MHTKYLPISVVLQHLETNTTGDATEMTNICVPRQVLPRGRLAAAFAEVDNLVVKTVCWQGTGYNNNYYYYF